jgi:hypothetical protein
VHGYLIILPFLNQNKNYMGNIICLNTKLIYVVGYSENYENGSRTGTRTAVSTPDPVPAKFGNRNRGSGSGSYYLNTSIKNC